MGCVLGLMTPPEFLPDQMLSAQTPVARFNLSAVPPQERFDVWHASIGCIFDVDIHRPQRQEQEFHATLEGGLIGALMIARTRTVFSFSGSELSRARGGGRCLTMPLLRASIARK